jgi:hypothetical protein
LAIAAIEGGGGSDRRTASAVPDPGARRTIYGTAPLHDHCARATKKIMPGLVRAARAEGGDVRMPRGILCRVHIAPAEVGQHYNILLQGTNVQSNVLACIRNERI